MSDLAMDRIPACACDKIYPRRPSLSRKNENTACQGLRGTIWRCVARTQAVFMDNSSIEVSYSGPSPK